MRQLAADSYTLNAMHSINWTTTQFHFQPIYLIASFWEKSTLSIVMNSKTHWNSTTMTELSLKNLAKMYNVLITIKKYLWFDCDNSFSSKICLSSQMKASSIQEWTSLRCGATSNSNVYLLILVIYSNEKIRRIILIDLRLIYSKWTIIITPNFSTLIDELIRTLWKYG